MIITDTNELKKICRDVSLFEAQDIIAKLETELDKSKIGVGLAANQIGIDAKVCIIRPLETIALINPVIVEKFDKSLFKDEGCLSFPGEFVTTARYGEILVKDLLHPAGLIYTGLEAVVVQHEVGHLYGEIMHDFVVEVPKGRNSLCWCGSERKYKKCCLGKEIGRNQR